MQKLMLICASVMLVSACGTQVPERTHTGEQPSVAATEPSVVSDQAVDQPAVQGVAEEVVVTGQLRAFKLSKSREMSTGLLSLSQASMAYDMNLRPQNTERYPDTPSNGVHWARIDPVSTFSIDVDTASYSNVRRMLNQGQLPQPQAVRIEELINYFNYDYPRSQDANVPFRVYTELGPSPWARDRHLLHVGINGWQPEENASLPPTNLVFLIDVSGSMQAPNKIGLLKQAMKLMVRQLRAEDTLSIAVYAGASGQVLAPTAGDQKATIEMALDNLQAGGSTNGEAGIRLAYQMARSQFKAEGINRVILATDGDFNVGTTDENELERLVEHERNSGVSLTVLGFGHGNYNDALMQKIAQIGNGNAAYIDSIHEARKVLVDELGATLNTIAKDVKIQLEFNPQVVESYRLIGYETRHLNREDFNNDKVDAGEIGAGHTVTALYELTLVGEGSSLVDPLRYGQDNQRPTQALSAIELGYLKLRYKAPNSDTSKLITQPLLTADFKANLNTTSKSFRFSAAVAWLGQILREDFSAQGDTIQDVIKLAQTSRGQDSHGYRSEFIQLARTAASLTQLNDHPVNPVALQDMRN